MTRVDLEDAIDIIAPHFNSKNGPYKVNGNLLMTNHVKIRTEQYKVMAKATRQCMRDGYRPTIECVDVRNENVLVLHASLRHDHIIWLNRRNWRWQDWPATKLPTLVRYKGKYMVWNGTHRYTLCKLAGRKLRCNVFDLEKFYEWKKTHPDGNVRVIKVKGKRRGHK